MKIYWYWPHPHREASGLARATLRPEDQLTVQALPSLRGERFGPIHDYQVVRDLPDPTQRTGVRMLRPLAPASLAWRRSRARRRLADRGFDVGLIQLLTYTTDWADIGGLRRRLPLLCQVHDVRPHRRIFPEAVELQLLRRTYRAAGDLAVYHQILKDELVSDFSIDPERVHIVPMAINASDLRDRATSQGSEPPTLLFFGTLRPNKGLDVLCDALQLLGPRPEMRVIIAGEGSDEMKSMLVSRLGRMTHVSLEFGHIGDARKHELFNNASWVLLPYTSFHSQSAVLSDAYSYRVPLIVSNVGALGPTVRDDATGVTIDPHDADALAGAINDALDGRTAVDDSAMNAAALAHDYSQVGPQLRLVFDSLVHSRRAGS